jgi:hydroxyacylglutathione hydrolase
MKTMKIHQIFFKNSLRNFCYLISFDDGAIYCIDPFESLPIINYLKDQSLTAIINTHDHCDHYSGNEELVLAYQCPVMAHAQALVPLKNRNLADQEIIYHGTHAGVEWTLKSVYTPGHTLSHLCVLLEKNNKAYALFTGDCFFNAGVGNCHNGGEPEVLYQTINTIFEKLPDDLLIYPGHDYLKRNLEFTNTYEPHNLVAQNFLKEISTLNLDEHFFINTMKTEREINTFLRLGSRDLLEKLNLVNSNEKQVFLTLRELRNRW